MSAVESPSPLRLPPGFAQLAAILILCTVAGLWLLDTRQPAPWADAATPWFEHVRATSSASAAIDGLNGRATLSVDLPFGSVLVVTALAVTTLLSLLALGVTPVLSMAVALGLVWTRSVWSTATPGHDAAPVAAVSLCVLAMVRPAGHRAIKLLTAAALLAVPGAVWVGGPALAANGSVRSRMGTASLGLLVALGLAVQVWLWHDTRSVVGCLEGLPWQVSLADVMRPGLTADVSVWMALRQWTAVLAGDVHLVGLVVAAHGFAMARRAGVPTLRRATSVALVTTGGAVIAGLLPPALAAALLLPWWAPWFGLGLESLLAASGGRHRLIGTPLVAVLIVLTSLLRAATVVPGPFAAGLPSMTRVVTTGLTGASISATADAVGTRRLRQAGARTIPADTPTVTACLAHGLRVTTVAASVAEFDSMGLSTEPITPRVPLAAVLTDLRDGQLVALALSPSSLPWAGAEGLRALGRIGSVHGPLHTTPAIAAIGFSGRGGLVAADRQRAEVRTEVAQTIGGHRVLAPVLAVSGAHETAVEQPLTWSVTGRHASLAVFDRTQHVVMRATATTEPGLTFAVHGHPDLIHASLGGTPRCVPGRDTWTGIPGEFRTIGVPTRAASAGDPVLVYVAADTPPRIDVSGLRGQGLPSAWSVETLDSTSAIDAARLAARLASDGVPSRTAPRGRWLARVSIGPSDPFHGGRAVVSAGAEPTGWSVRLPAMGRHAEATAVCAVAAPAERLLPPDRIDDDSPFERAVWPLDGWHAQEIVRGRSHRWSARATASVGFTLASTRGVSLVLDAEAATTASGPQPLVVSVNGRVLRDDWRGADRLAVPDDALREGDNVLTLAVPAVVRPGRDPRTLGVLVRELRVIAHPRP